MKQIKIVVIAGEKFSAFETLTCEGCHFYRTGISCPVDETLCYKLCVSRLNDGVSVLYKKIESDPIFKFGDRVMIQNKYTNEQDQAIVVSLNEDTGKYTIVLPDGTLHNNISPDLLAAFNW